MDRLMHRIFWIVRIYVRCFINSLKINFYYTDFFVVLSGMLARDSIAIILIYFLTERFFDIGGWEGPELLFLYCLLYISYGIAMLFLAGVRTLEDDIAYGTFDRYMVTPLGIFFQAIVAKVDLAATACYCILGTVLFIYSSDILGISWSMEYVAVLVIALLGGMLIQSALLLVGSIFAFWAVRTGQLRFLLFFNIRKTAIFPVGIYPRVFQLILMYVLPFAFVNYFPARFILEKGENRTISLVFALLSLVVGCILFLLVYIFWRLGIKNYKSTGN